MGFLQSNDSNSPGRNASKLDPAWLTHRRHLPGGDTICLRAIQPRDRVALREELFLKLGTQSLRNRFLGTKLDLTESELTHFCRVDFDLHVALVAEIETAGHRRLVGTGRFARASTEATEAEIAITVQDNYQGRGIGRLLLQKLVYAARELGIERLEATMFAQNYRMAKLMRGSRRPCDSCLENGILTLSLDLRTPASPAPPRGGLRLCREASHRQEAMME